MTIADRAISLNSSSLQRGFETWPSMPARETLSSCGIALAVNAMTVGVTQVRYNDL